MSLIEQYVDRALLSRVLDWVQDAGGFAGFEPDQAVIAVFIARHWRPESLPPDEEAAFLLALTMTFLNWFDDRCDRHLRQKRGLIHWDRLLGFTDGAVTDDGAMAPEESFLLRLGEVVRRKAATADEFAWWRREVAKVLCGTRFEELVAREGLRPSLVERLEYGAMSIAATLCLCTAYLGYGMGRLLRSGDPVLARLERAFATYQRVLNDFQSADKERREGRPGGYCNLVLLMEEYLPCESAREFVGRQVEGCRRLILADLEVLGIADPFARLIRSLLELGDRMYELRPLRYQNQ